MSSGTSRLGILLPMVLSADDFKRAQDAFESVASAMRIEARPALGAMIETPSALFELDELLELADFVSIGTNDLVQSMLAIERRSMEAFEEDVMLQPARPTCTRSSGPRGRKPRQGAHGVRRGRW